MRNLSFANMHLSPVSRTPSFDSGAIEKLADNKMLSESEKVDVASQQFEALMLRQIISAARKPVFQSSLIQPSASTSIYQDLVTHQLAESISKSGDFGLSQSLASRLKPAEQEGLTAPRQSTLD